MSETVLVTGASGFVGSALCACLRAQGRIIRAAVRCPDSMSSAGGLDVVVVGEVGGQTDWSDVLVGVDCVIHCAAHVHVTQRTMAELFAAYREANVAGTQRLAEQAAALGVRRLVFLSSIKVNGESTDGLPRPFEACNDHVSNSACGGGVNWKDPYGVSKWEAELALWAVSARTDLEVVVVRPPLVYGPGVKGNLLSLLGWVAQGVPMPLKGLKNQRSLVGLSNLVDLLIHCAEHPAAVGQTFLASDGQDLSTPQLVCLIAEGMNRPARLMHVPTVLLQVAGSLLGKRGEIDRLIGSLQVDSSYTQLQLGWTPPVSVEDGVQEMARWYAGLKDTQAL